jgi:16S rRNA (guanine(1405)-N(7))-methyltransferase
MSHRPNPLDQLVGAVLTSAKYRALSEDVIRRIGARELAAEASVKKAVKATKNKLHQIGGVYFDARPDYSANLALLRESAGDTGRLRDACRAIMSQHASTRERLPILDRFYAETLAGLGPLQSVIDLACGLNPLAIPWMPLTEGARYHAVDIYTDLIAFIGEAMNLIRTDGTAEVCDITGSLPPHKADLALLLKAIPCLEQIDKAAGLRLLEEINAGYILVSFPARSLGGYDKGMIENYEAHFLEMIKEKPWAVRRFEFETELAFLVIKQAGSA